MYKNYMRTVFLVVALTMVSVAFFNAQSILAVLTAPALAAAAKAQVVFDPDPCSKIIGTIDGAD